MDRYELLEVAGLLKALRRCLLDAGPRYRDASDWALVVLVEIGRAARWTPAELRAMVHLLPESS